MADQLNLKTVVKYVGIGALTGVGTFFAVEWLKTRFGNNEGGII